MMVRWREQPALLILGALALTSGLYLFFNADIIAKDGTLYVAQARFFSQGDWRSGLALEYPPLYPALIALAQKLTGNWDRAGQLISLLFYLFAMVPLYMWGREAHGKGVAWLALLLYAFHPAIARNSAEVLTETTYTFFLVLSLCLSWRALAGASLFLFLLAGAFSGLAYLVRPEGLGIVLVVGLWIVLSLPWKKKLAALALLGISTAIFLAPYVLYIKAETGQWRLSKKKEITALAGVGQSEESRIKKELVEKREAAKGREEKRESFGPLSPGRYARDFLLLLLKFAKTYHPLLVLIALFPLFLSLPMPIARKQELFIASVLGLYFIVLYRVSISYGYRTVVGRHFEPLVALSLFWAARGGLALYNGISLKLVGEGQRGNWRRLLAPTFIVLVVLILSFNTFKPLRPDKAQIREAGLWIKSQGQASPVILAEDSRVAYYGEGRHAALFYNQVKDVLELVESRQVDYLVLEKGHLKLLGLESVQAQIARGLKTVPLKGKERLPEGKRLVLFRLSPKS